MALPISSIDCFPQSSTICPRLPAVMLYLEISALSGSSSIQSIQHLLVLPRYQRFVPIRIFVSQLGNHIERVHFSNPVTVSVLFLLELVTIKIILIMNFLKIND